MDVFTSGWDSKQKAHCYLLTRRGQEVHSTNLYAVITEKGKVRYKLSDVKQEAQYTYKIKKVVLRADPERSKRVCLNGHTYTAVWIYKERGTQELTRECPICEKKLLKIFKKSNELDVN